MPLRRASKVTSKCSGVSGSGNPRYPGSRELGIQNPAVLPGRIRGDPPKSCRGPGTDFWCRGATLVHVAFRSREMRVLACCIIRNRGVHQLTCYSPLTVMEEWRTYTDFWCQGGTLVHTYSISIAGDASARVLHHQERRSLSPHVLFTANRDGGMENSLRSGIFATGGATFSSMRSRSGYVAGEARLSRWIGRVSTR